MFGNFITFSDDFATSTLQVAGYLISDLEPYLKLIIGVLIIVLVVAGLIKAIHK